MVHSFHDCGYDTDGALLSSASTAMISSDAVGASVDASKTPWPVFFSCCDTARMYADKSSFKIQEKKQGNSRGDACGSVLEPLQAANGTPCGSVVEVSKHVH